MYDIILGRKEADRQKLGKRATVLVGKQYVSMGTTTSLANNIYLDVATSHVFFVCGKRGSGKSYSMSAIAEGIISLEPEVRQNISMILLDTMGVFWPMKYPNKKDKKLLAEWDLEPKGLDVQIFTPIGSYEKHKEEGVPTDFPFSIQPNELDADDWNTTFGIERNSELGVLLEKVINLLKEHRASYSIQDIIDAVQDEEAESTTKNALVNRFLNAKSWGLFSKTGTTLKQLVTGGKVTVLDVSAYATTPNGWAIKSLVIGLVTKKLFIERMKARKIEEFQDIKSQMEYFRTEETVKKKEPLVWLVIDEAHEFLPNKGKTTATEPLVTVLREGRQPGISLILATQQPGKIHSDVMTQSDLILSHRLTAQMDIKALQSLGQSYLREGIDQTLNKLPRVPGAGLVIDDANERLYMMRVRPKISWHGGSAPTALPEEKEEI